MIFDQLFTIPIGRFLGGFLVDKVFEPIVEQASADSMLVRVCGYEKGSGTAIVMLVLGIASKWVCLAFRRVLKKYSFAESNQ